MLVKYIIIIFSLFVVYKAEKKFKNKDISKREYSLWIVFWIMVIMATLMPKNIDKIAQFAGVERGADLIVYLSIMIIFYLIFRILVSLEKIDREITTIVRKIALNKDIKNEDEKNSHFDD
ncbi:MAG: DUF2304 domain-containing protein [bacterium]